MAMVRTHKRVKFATTAGMAAVAIAAHVAILGGAQSLDLHFGWFGHAEAATVDDEEAELRASCRGDVVLHYSASFAMCAAPWQSEGSTCVDDTSLQFWIEMSSCENLDVSLPLSERTDIALAPQREKIKEIDPEQLLDSVKQEQQQQPKPPAVPPPQPQNTPPPPPAPPAPPKQAQVVETVKPPTEQAPNNARFLSEYDIKVDKQKVARGAKSEPMIAKSQSETLAPKENPKEASVQKKDPDRDPGKDRRAADVPGTLSMRKPGAQAPAETAQDQKTRGATSGASGNIAMDGLGQRRGDGAIEQQKKDHSEQPRGDNGAGGGQPNTPNLKPSADQLERALGGGSVDHLDDVENGDETALSSKKWIYASFFNRLKRQVAQNWDPQTVWRRLDPNGTVYGGKTRVTEVRVSLSKRGEVSKVIVTAPSGVNDLDEEAVRSFHAAGPFPNPPEGLVSKDNLITFAFSFYFEIGGSHTSWRVIRSM